MKIDKKYTKIGLLICLFWLSSSIIGLFDLIRLSANTILFLTLIYDISLVFFILYFLIKKNKINIKTFGFSKFKARDLGLGCSFLIIFFIFNGLYNWTLMTKFKELPTQADYLFPMFRQLDSPLILFVTAVIIGPFAEEVFFRGFLLNALNQFYKFEKAALIASIIFSGLHLIPSAILPIFVLGYFFCMLYHKSKSLWPGIILHTLINFISFVGFILIT